MEILIIWGLSMFWCYKIAKKNNRNALIALAVSYFCGPLAVIGYYLVGEKKDNNAGINKESVKIKTTNKALSKLPRRKSTEKNDLAEIPSNQSNYINTGDLNLFKSKEKSVKEIAKMAQEIIGDQPKNFFGLRDLMIETVVSDNRNKDSFCIDLVQQMEKQSPYGYGYIITNIANGAPVGNGYGVVKKPELIFKWAKEAALRGAGNALPVLAGNYLFGTGTKRDLYKAVKLTELSVCAPCRPEIPYEGRIGNIDVMAVAFVSGKCTNYDDGKTYVIPINYNYAYNLIKLGTELGSGLCTALLAGYYEDGIIVKSDLNEALRLYRKAGSKTDSERVESLIKELDDFKGTLVKAQRGDVKAQINVGLGYLLGRNCEKDEEKALDWFITAANNGNQDAFKHYIEILMINSNDSNNLSKALKACLKFFKVTGELSVEATGFSITPKNVVELANKNNYYTDVSFREIVDLGANKKDINYIAAKAQLLYNISNTPQYFSSRLQIDEFKNNLNKCIEFYNSLVNDKELFSKLNEHYYEVLNHCSLRNEYSGQNAIEVYKAEREHDGDSAYKVAKRNYHSSEKYGGEEYLRYLKLASSYGHSKATEELNKLQEYILKEKEEARRKAAAEEEARRKAEAAEEARRKAAAEEEARRKAEAAEEVRRKAAAEEARRKAAAEEAKPQKEDAGIAFGWVYYNYGDSYLAPEVLVPWKIFSREKYLDLLAGSPEEWRRLVRHARYYIEDGLDYGDVDYFLIYNPDWDESETSKIYVKLTFLFNDGVMSEWLYLEEDEWMVVNRNQEALKILVRGYLWKNRINEIADVSIIRSADIRNIRIEKVH